MGLEVDMPLLDHDGVVGHVGLVPTGADPLEVQPYGLQLPADLVVVPAEDLSSLALRTSRPCAWLTWVT